MNRELIYFILILIKYMLISYIIVSAIVAIGVIKCNKSASQISYIYCLICYIDLKTVIKNKQLYGLLRNGLTYAFIYVYASIRLRCALGSNYKKKILDNFDTAIKLSKYNTGGDYDKAMSMYAKDLWKEKLGEENSDEKEKG